MANFDPVAPLYRWLEYGSFGPCLQRCRRARLGEMAGARRVLVYGDGDGRFLQRFVRVNPGVLVDAVDSSPAMLRRLRARVAGAGAGPRVACYCADALAFPPPGAEYDLVVAHFFLDCFTDGELDRLLDRITPHMAPGARWIVSEFAIPPSGPVRPVARVVVAGLYRAFGLLTGLRPRRLPDYGGCLRRHDFMLEAKREFLGGLLRSERWRLTGR